MKYPCDTCTRPWCYNCPYQEEEEDANNENQ